MTLYSRPGCHLCDEARAVLVAEGVAFTEVDIESEDRLFKRYLERIPVVSIDGEDAFDLFLDAAALRAAVGSQPGGHARSRR